ncbi:MAG: M15 family metallopeptidase [Candidatus Gracilibacteria bacterium]
MASEAEKQPDQLSPSQWIEEFQKYDPEVGGRIILPANLDELPPIPPLSEQEAAKWASLAWKRMPIDDKNPLHHMGVVSARNHLICDPIYNNQDRKGSYPEIFVRYIVLGIMMAIDKVLKKRGLNVLAWDGWRSAETQLDLFDEQKGKLAAGDPAKSEEALKLETQKYVSVPTAHPYKPSPHMTGGAVDWTIANSNGDPLKMGCEFDDFSAVAGTRHFEGLNRPLSADEKEARLNRRIHYWVSKRMGMENYPEEYWHSSWGDQMWAMAANKQSAILGPAPMASVSQLVDPRKTIKVNLPELKGKYIIEYPRNREIRQGIPVNSMDFNTATWAIHEVNIAVRALYEADRALNGVRELTHQEIMNIIQSVVKKEVRFERAA